MSFHLAIILANTKLRHSRVCDRAGSIKERAEVLHQTLHKELRGKDFNIIAHSMVSNISFLIAVIKRVLWYMSRAG